MRKRRVGSIPGRIAEIGRTDTLSVGAQKALSGMIQSYGSVEKGTQVFIDKAKEQGTGNTTRQKANSIYKTGAHIK